MKQTLGECQGLNEMDNLFAQKTQVLKLIFQDNLKLQAEDLEPEIPE